MSRLSRAIITDIEGIGAVVQDVWKQEILPGVCKAQIEDDAGALWVAKAKDDVLGFISAFLTVDKAGRRRWEVDLVAVRPAHQGKGLGQRLIRRVWQDAEGRNAVEARALIRVNNLPSQKAFRRAGFTSDSHVQRLLLWPPKLAENPAPCPDGVSLLAVDTLTYRGLWIEGLASLPHAEQRSVVRTARATIARENRLNTGALVLADRERLLSPDLRAQAKVHGEYYWFTKPSQET